MFLKISEAYIEINTEMSGVGGNIVETNSHRDRTFVSGSTSQEQHSISTGEKKIGFLKGTKGQTEIAFGSL
jgi:hypothetical protein